MLGCCHCSWQCLSWNRLSETCWCAATAHDSASVGTGWDMLVCCHCSWQCLSWNRLRHVGVLPLLMTLSQLEQVETCWCAATARDSASIATFWDMLVCCPYLWQCLSCNILRHVGVLSVLMTVSQLQHSETCWCAVSAHDNVWVGNSLRRVGVLPVLMTVSRLETVWDMLVCCQCLWQCLRRNRDQRSSLYVCKKFSTVPN